MVAPVRVGVLALQGAVSEHMRAVRRVGARGVPVKRPEDLAAADALIIPGGESTALSRLIRRNGLSDAIRDFSRTRPVLGTCAGLILCASRIEGADEDLQALGLMDISVVRNGFGRQVDSFETPLTVTDLGTIRAVFIRAPFIRSAGPGVRVMAELDNRIVMARQGKVLVSSFHPELTDDVRIFEYFTGMLDTTHQA
jgi:5'-phosphate synthase pdxT subunit